MNALRIAALVVVVAVACRDRTLKGSAITPPKAVPHIELTSATGNPVTLTSGKPTLVFFGYTHCPDVCPTTLADWARIRQRLGARANNVQFLFVSIDPERDTPTVAQNYVEKFDSGIVAVAPDSSSLSALQQALGASSFRDTATSGGEYLMAHSSQTFLLNGKGEFIALYSFGSGWDTMLHDVEMQL